MENINLLLEEINYFWKRKAAGNPKCVHVYMCMHTHTQAMRTHAYGMRMHA